MVQRASGNLPQSLTVLEEAIQLEEAGRGTHHPRVAVTLNAAGTVLRGMGDYQRAREFHNRALTVIPQALAAAARDAAMEEPREAFAKRLQIGKTFARDHTRANKAPDFETERIFLSKQIAT